jgi:hypothetical protein
LTVRSAQQRQPESAERGIVITVAKMSIAGTVCLHQPPQHIKSNSKKSELLTHFLIESNGHFILEIILKNAKTVTRKPLKPC